MTQHGAEKLRGGQACICRVPNRRTHAPAESFSVPGSLGNSIAASVLKVQQPGNTNVELHVNHQLGIAVSVNDKAPGMPSPFYRLPQFEQTCVWGCRSMLVHTPMLSCFVIPRYPDG